MISVTTYTLPFFHSLRITLETTDERGVISSANYPGNYQNQADTLFIITAPEGSHVKLTFLDLKIEDKCAFDTLTISYGRLYYTLLNKYKPFDKHKL